MLKLGTKIQIFLIPLVVLLSCETESRFNKKVVLDNRELFLYYQDLYEQIHDTLTIWEKDSLAISLPYFESMWMLDSLIAINYDTTRLYCNLLQSESKWKNSKIDIIQGIGGARIDNQWYFFFGSSTVIERAAYQDSIYSPLNFDELSYLAQEHLQDAYFIDSKGNIRSNDDFFKFMYNRISWGLPDNSSLEQLDSLIVAKTKNVRKVKINLEELEDIKENIATSKKPPEPQKKERSWWDKIIKPEKVKIFESDEWKNRSK